MRIFYTANKYMHKVNNALSCLVFSYKQQQNTHAISGLNAFPSTTKQNLRSLTLESEKDCLACENHKLRYKV